MASRLDRLVTILETGSTRLIRDTAVNQLADWQKQHPEELFNLLGRVVRYLHHKDWDTRTTAAKAVGKIIENAPPYEPNPEDDFFLKEEGDRNPEPLEQRSGAVDGGPDVIHSFQYDSVDIYAIIQFGRELLRTGSIDLALARLTPQERLAHENQSLPARLGLLGRRFDDDECDAESDAAAGKITPEESASRPGYFKNKTSSQTIIAEESGLSSRQLNVLKRKRKREAQQAALGKTSFADLSFRNATNSTLSTMSDAPADESPMADVNIVKGGKIQDSFTLDRPVDVDEDAKVVSEFKGPILPIKSELETEEVVEGAEWPYDRLCAFLKVDLFNPKWGTRHGAAMALREIIRVHGAGAGRRGLYSRRTNDHLNQQWLDDLACRLCCVLLLDRFTDYSSDTSVAPIRETIGQTLGSVLKHIPSQSVVAIYRILHRMIMQEGIQLDRAAWPVCHGGMIGLRYVVAVRKDLLLQDGNMIDGILEAVIRGLGNADDDVRSVSAATLVPMAEEVVTMRADRLDELIGIVWESFSNLGDDLSASTGKMMDLLATLCNFPEVLQAMKSSAEADEDRSFTLLVPRLYPFLRHTITSVRLAVLKALLTFAGLSTQAADGWLNGRILRLVFQNVLVERDKETLEASLNLWTAFVRALSFSPTLLASEFEPHLESLGQLALHPIGTSRYPIPMNSSLFQKPSGSAYAPIAGGASTLAWKPPSPDIVPERAPKRRRRSAKTEELPTPPPAHDVDGAMMLGDVDLLGMDVLIRSRISAAKAMGLLMGSIPESTLGQYKSLLLAGLTSPFSSTQLAASVTVDEYAKECGSPVDAAEFISRLTEMVEGERPAHYRDLVNFVHRVRTQCTQLINLFRDHGKVPQSKLPTLAVIVQGEPEAGPTAFSIANGQKVIGEEFDKMLRAVPPGQRLIVTEQLEEARAVTRMTLDEAIAATDRRHIRIKAAAGCALIALGCLPPKPSPVIKAIMDSVKYEDIHELQTRAATTIAQVVRLLNSRGRRGPADKVVGNLVKFSCVEIAETPEFGVHAHKKDCILSMQKEEHSVDRADMLQWAREAKAARVTRRGAKEALEILSTTYKAELLNQVPSLRALMADALQKAFMCDHVPAEAFDVNGTIGQEIVDGLSLIRTMTPTLDEALRPFIMELVPLIIDALHSELSVFRYMAAKCMATVCSVMTVDGMTALVTKVLPSANNAVDVRARQGAIEVIYHLIAVMGDSILPYVVFLIVPVLGRMSDSDQEIRLIATKSFATLVKLVPLEAGIPDPPGLSQELLAGRDRERTFIGQLLDPKKVEPFQIPVAIKAELRSYQQDGVNWLHFLNRYHLHGILCDDMGLGKTLQTLCIVASDHHQRAEEFRQTGAADVRQLPSLIVCPPSLSGHWQQEIKAFAPFLSVATYIGPPAERKALKERLHRMDVVITSYDVCRNDCEALEKFSWNYVVLDEGHLIKNPKAKTSIAVKRLASNHRLILTGTPIQNNVLELWSLFDFLMPGFLGSEKLFIERFAKPIAASRMAKASSKEQETGALAIESLHKQVLPFLLRRLKEEVLDDLPPKIIQNYYCNMSDLQRKLFDDFTKRQGDKIQNVAGRDDREAKQHIFQALQYMRKLWNSPALVMKPAHALYSEIQKILKKQGSSMEDPVHAPKLMALRDLLVDCGIGVEGTADSTDPLYQPIKPHRALIFCQMKEMLDMVQNTVLKRLLPSVSFLRMDGSVDASRRQDIVNRFNSDPSYDVLLLTTSVGGLGLNLTGADTVIFVEHDWNPQKDVQAMDRAHRIGQKKVVNVYRIITRGTLEEKIMSLQRFKIDVASTVVNQQNAGLSTMDTDQILDLFSLSDSGPNLMEDKTATTGAGAAEAAAAAESSAEDMLDMETGDVLRQPAKKTWMNELDDLWDNRQYEESFDLDGFLKTMR